MFNWYIKITEFEDGEKDENVKNDSQEINDTNNNTSEQQLENWIIALLWVIEKEFINAIPDNTVMLCQLCIQTEDEEQAQIVQDMADDLINSKETRQLRPIAIETALGRLKPLELSQFLSKQARWYKGLKLDQSQNKNHQGKIHPVKESLNQESRNKEN